MADNWMAAGRYRWVETALPPKGKAPATLVVRGATASHKAAALYKLQELWVAESGRQEWRDVPVGKATVSPRGTMR